MATRNQPKCRLARFGVMMGSQLGVGEIKLGMGVRPFKKDASPQDGSPRCGEA